MGEKEEEKIPKDGGDSGQVSCLSLPCSYFGACETVLSHIFSHNISLSLRFFLLPICLFVVLFILL